MSLCISVLPLARPQSLRPRPSFPARATQIPAHHRAARFVWVRVEQAAAGRGTISGRVKTREEDDESTAKTSTGRRNQSPRRGAYRSTRFRPR